MKKAPENKLTKTKKFNKTTAATFILPVVLFAIVQTLTTTGNLSSHMKGLLVPICYYVILAISLNITVGISGELSLGHAGFMCAGAFSGALFSLVTKEIITISWLRFGLAFLVGGLVAALFGLIIGIPILRLRGDYLAIVTLAFGEIIKNICGSIYLGYDSTGLHASFNPLEMDADGTLLINGPLGISGVPKQSTFIIGFVLIMITIFVCVNFINSRTGRAVMAIRDNRIAAESIGINITKHKLIAFCLSAFFAGIAGVLYSHNLATITSTSKNFGYNMSIMILVFVVMGGMGSTLGSMIAAIILTILPEIFRSFGNYRMLIYAIALIVMMIFTSAPACIAFREKITLTIKNKLKRSGEV